MLPFLPNFQPGIRLSDYLSFYQVLYSINDIDTALTFYHMAGAPIERDTMRHVAKGPYLYDVRKIFGFLDPSCPPCPHLVII